MISDTEKKGETLYLPSDFRCPICANLRIDLREAPDSRESFQGSRTEPLFCESRFGGLKIVNRRFEAIRANRSHVMKVEAFLRIDLRESIRTNRLDSRCESQRHLSIRLFLYIHTSMPYKPSVLTRLGLS